MFLNGLGTWAPAWQTQPMCWTSNFFSSVRRQDLETRRCHTKPRHSFPQRISVMPALSPFQGQSTGGLHCSLMDLIHFLSFWRFIGFCLILPFLYSCVLSQIINIVFKIMCFQKCCHPDKLNLKVFALTYTNIQNLDPIVYVLNSFCPTFTICSIMCHLPYNLRKSSPLIWASYESLVLFSLL